MQSRGGLAPLPYSVVFVSQDVAVNLTKLDIGKIIFINGDKCESHKISVFNAEWRAAK